MLQNVPHVVQTLMWELLVPGEGIWHHRMWSTLVQVRASSPYLNQYWFITNIYWTQNGYQCHNFHLVSFLFQSYNKAQDDTQFAVLEIHVSTTPGSDPEAHPYRVALYKGWQKHLEVKSWQSTEALYYDSHFSPKSEQDASLSPCNSSYPHPHPHHILSSKSSHPLLVFILITFYPHPNLNPHFDGLVQERSNSIANTLELHLSCTNPSISFSSSSGPHLILMSFLSYPRSTLISSLSSSHSHHILISFHLLIHSSSSHHLISPPPSFHHQSQYQ